MIDYMCSYSRKSWKASVVFVEKAANYTMLNIRSDLFEGMNVFLWHKNEEYWLAIPEIEASCFLAYPTDTFWNFESIARSIKNKYVAKTIACGITEYFKKKDIRTDIEEYIKHLSGRINTYKSSVVLYDPYIRAYHLLYLINRKKDDCTMLTMPVKKDDGYCEVSTPFISQLNAFYNHCEIIKTSPYLQKDIRILMKKY